MCLPLTVRHEAILQTQTIHLDHVPSPLVIARVPHQAVILHNSDVRDCGMSRFDLVENRLTEAFRIVCHMLKQV